jgi:hypothetical protein
MRTIDQPPVEELFPVRVFAARHPHFLNESKVRWAIRNRSTNGLQQVGAIFETRAGAFLVHEPTFIRWFLGLEGRSRPRCSPRREKIDAGALKDVTP